AARGERPTRRPGGKSAAPHCHQLFAVPTLTVKALAAPPEPAVPTAPVVAPPPARPSPHHPNSGPATWLLLALVVLTFLNLGFTAWPALRGGDSWEYRV